MKTMLFNPYTGTPRHPSDIKSDPKGLLIVEPEEPMIPAVAKIMETVNEFLPHADLLPEDLEPGSPAWRVINSYDEEQPLAATVQDAALDVRKWFVEHPNRPLDMRHVEWVIHYAIQAESMFEGWIPPSEQIPDAARFAFIEENKIQCDVRKNGYWEAVSKINPTPWVSRKTLAECIDVLMQA